MPEPTVVNISEAKAQLSRLVDRVFHGEKIVIAKNNLPVADLVPHQPEGKRKLGLLKGKLDLPDDLFEPDPEIEEMFYRESD
jgi:prevent-host-death family protein